MDKKELTLKLQEQIDQNNRHIKQPLFWRKANKKERKQLKAQENTIPLIKWQEKIIL